MVLFITIERKEGGGVSDLIILKEQIWHNKSVLNVKKPIKIYQRNGPNSVHAFALIPDTQNP